MSAPHDAVLNEDETRSNTPGRGDFVEGGDRTPFERTTAASTTHYQHHPMSSGSEKATTTNSSPKFDRSTAGGRRTTWKSEEWADIDHAPRGDEHGLGRPMPDDRSGAEFGTSKDHAYPHFKGDLPWSQRKWWYQIIPGRGMYFDLRRRLPFLVSDWTAAFEPRNWYTVAQYVIRMYFINLMPALSYIIDMNHRTGGAYGVNEVILASALAAIVFPIFAIQPLTFVGVTGLINLVNYTQYDIVVGYYGLDRLDYLRVQAWSLIWAAFFHFVVAIFNISDFTRFITDMTSETFGFYVGIVYIQKGIELLILEYKPAPLDNATGWFSVTIAILFTISVYLVTKIGSTSFGPFRVRYFISSFAFAAGCVFWTGFSHFPRNSLERIPIERLPITKSFFPSIDRPWFIDFWNIELRWVFVGAPLGFLIMLLFYFDHNVSSVMAQARQFPVKKPAGFHWDFFLLGVTTLVSGFLGLPAPNGLVPQCPWSTDSLSVYRQVDKGTHGTDEEAPLIGQKGKKFKRQHVINERVVESRIAPLLVGGLTLATMTRPFLVALGTMPRALFAGIFILVGWSSIEGNGITRRTIALFQDRRLSDYGNGLLQVKRSKLALYVGIQWVFFALTISISQTIAAIGFPVIIVLLIPFRYSVVPKWFSPSELRILDAPTANADVVLASLGHETEAVTGQGMRIARDTKIAGTEYPESDYGDDDDLDKGGDFAATSQGAKNTHKSEDVAGYTIGDEDDDYATERDQPGRATPFTDIDPEGHYRNWVDQSDHQPAHNEYPRDTAAALGAGAAVGAAVSSSDEKTPQQQPPSSAAAVDTTAKSKGKPKENKRTKSVTQSWWGTGKSEPVQRAQTPTAAQSGAQTTQASSIGQDSAQHSSSTDSATKAAAGVAAGGGLGAWLSRKKHGNNRPSTSEEPIQEHGMSESPVEMHEAVPAAGQATDDNSGQQAMHGNAPVVQQHSEAPTMPADLPGANFEPLSQGERSETPAQGGLFASMTQSPSEAGTIAAEAVRSMQADAHRGALAGGASNDMAMPSNVPSNMPVPRFGQDQHQISLDPNDPHHIHVESPHPGTSIDINRGSVQLMRDGEGQTPMQLSGSSQSSKSGGLKRTNSSKEEEKLQNLLRKQAKERRASEAKREKLQGQLRAIEEKAALAKATGSAGSGTASSGQNGGSAPAGAVPRLPRSMLTAMSGQVAGHEDGIYTLAQNSYVVKPCTPTESRFYDVAVIETPKTISRTQRNLIKRLRTFLPTFHGQIDIIGNSALASSIAAEHPASSRAIILENLSRDYNFANVLDVKLGKQLWDEDASDAKRQRMDDVAARTTSGSSGIRLTGWRTWDPTHATFTHVDKTFGKSIQAAQLETGLRCFFGLGSDGDAQIVSDHSKQRYSPPRLPYKNLEAIIDEGVLPAVDEIIDIVKKLHWRMRGGSLLIAFEGDPAIISLVTKKSDLWAGRRSTDKDSEIDLSHLESTPIVAPALRLVDVRLIDFAHTRFVDDGRDDGLLAGLETLRHLLARIAKDARKGKIGQKDFGVANDAAAPSSGIGEPVLVGVSQSRASTDRKAAPVVASAAPDGAAVATTPAASKTAANPPAAGSAEVAPGSPAKDDAQSVRSDKRKSRGILGIFGGKQDKKDAKDTKEPSAENAPANEVSRKPSRTRVSEAPQTLPPLAFESSGAQEPAREQGLSDASASQSKDGKASEVAAPAALGALGAGGVYLATRESKPTEDKKAEQQVPPTTTAQAVPQVAQQATPHTEAPAPVSVSIPAQQDKGKGRAIEPEEPVTDSVNVEREHPHGSGLNAVLHDKGVIGQPAETPTLPESDSGAKNEDTTKRHGEELVGGAALLGAGAVAADKHHKDKEATGGDAEPEAHPDDEKTSKAEKRRGIFGLFGKDKKKDAQEPDSAATDAAVEHPATSAKDELARKEEHSTSPTASQADPEKDKGKDHVGIIDLMKPGAPAPLDLLDSDKQKDHDRSAATAPGDAAATSQVGGEQATSDKGKEKEHVGLIDLMKPGAPAPLDLIGSHKQADQTTGEEPSQHPASGIEGLRGQSQADAEKQLRDESEAREQYHAQAVAPTSKEHDAADVAAAAVVPATAIEAARGESSADAERKLKEEADARQAYHEQAVAHDEERKKGGILGLFKKDSKDNDKDDKRTADTEVPATAMEAARGESSADAERKLKDEADARQAYHEQAVAQADEKKKHGILGVFSKGSKDNEDEAKTEAEAPASAMEAARGESTADAERKLKDEADAREAYHQQAVAAADEKKKHSVLGLFKKGSKENLADNPQSSAEAPASAMEAARGESTADAERKLKEETDAREAYHQQAVAAADEKKKGSILGLFKTGAPAPLEGSAHHGKEHDKEVTPASDRNAPKPASGDQPTAVDANPTAEKEHKTEDAAVPAALAAGALGGTALASHEDKKGDEPSTAARAGVEDKAATAASTAPQPSTSIGMPTAIKEDAVKNDAPATSAMLDPATSRASESPNDAGAAQNREASAAAAIAAAGAGAGATAAAGKDQDAQRRATEPASEAPKSQPSSPRKSSESRRHGFLGFFKKGSKDEMDGKPSDGASQQQQNPAIAQKATNAGDKQKKDADLERDAALGAGAGLAGAALAKEAKEDPNETARKEAAHREQEALKKSQAEQAARKQADEKKLLAEAAAVKREEDENAKAREKKAQEDAMLREKKAEEEAKAREKKAQEDAKLREKKAQEEAKLREKKEKEEAKLQKKRAKEQAKADKEKEKADRKKAKEEEKQKREREKAAEKEAAAAAAALAAQKKEAADAKKRNEEQAKQQAAQQKEAQAAAEALELNKKEAADLEAQRLKEAAEFEKTKAEAAEMEKQRNEEKELLEKQRKEAAELQERLKREEAALQKQKEELAALEERIRKEQEAIQKQRELAEQLAKQKQEEQAAFEAKHSEAAELERKRLEEQTAIEDRQREVAEADKALDAEKAKNAEQQRSVEELEKKRKDEEAALAKQKEDAARLEKERQSELEALEKQRKEASDLEKKRHEEEALLEKQRQEVAEIEKKRAEEEALAKKQQKEAAELHKRQQEEAANLQKAREELAVAEEARKKEQAEQDHDKKEAAKLHKKAEKEAAALKLSQKQTAKIHEKMEKEQAALDKAQADAAAAEEAQRKEAAALEEKRKEREQARDRNGSSAPSDVKDGDANEHSVLEKMALAAAAVPLTATALHSHKDKDEKPSEDGKTPASPSSDNASSVQSRPSRFLASIRRRSHKPTPSETKAEQKTTPAPALPATAAKEDVALPSFSGAPAGGNFTSALTSEPSRFTEKPREEKDASEPSTAASAAATGIGSAPKPSAQSASKAPSASKADSAKTPSDSQKAKPEHRGGFFGLFKSKTSENDKATAPVTPAPAAKKPTPPPAKHAEEVDQSPAPPSKEPGFVKVGRGTRGTASESVPGSTQENSSWPAQPVDRVRKSMESGRTTGSRRSKREGPRAPTATGAPAISGPTAARPMTTVEEIVEQTKDGPRTYLVHTNPTRGPGKAPSAVQWRNHFNL